MDLESLSKSLIVLSFVVIILLLISWFLPNMVDSESWRYFTKGTGVGISFSIFVWGFVSAVAAAKEKKM